MNTIEKIKIEADRLIEMGRSCPPEVQRILSKEADRLRQIARDAEIEEKAYEIGAW